MLPLRSGSFWLVRFGCCSYWSTSVCYLVLRLDWKFGMLPLGLVGSLGNLVRFGCCSCWCTLVCSLVMYSLECFAASASTLGFVLVVCLLGCRMFPLGLSYVSAIRLGVQFIGTRLEWLQSCRLGWSLAAEMQIWFWLQKCRLGPFGIDAEMQIVWFPFYYLKIVWWLADMGIC